jgi:membrane-bound lytic murein transglycosylase D
MNLRISTCLQQICLCVCFLGSTITVAQALFPRPAELQPDIDFWVMVYTKVDTSSGFIHDSDNVSVIYESLQLTGEYYADRKLMKKVMARYANTLRSIAGNQSGDFTAEEQRVFSLWGEETSSERLLEAADGVRFQRGQSDRFREGLVRSGEWNRYIDSVLEERGLPRELGILPHVESSFNPKAYSRAGAAGIWQFTRSTGRRYLHVDYVVDERMDPFAATVAAAQLLEHNYQLTGTWPLALTAYNHGASSLRRASKQLGTTDITTILRDYKGRSFGFASRNFYLSFLAALEVSSNPERYFAPYQDVSPVAYVEVELPDYLLAESFARAFDTDLDLLKPHNRALLAPIWSGKKRIPKGFTMRIPNDNVVGAPADLMAAIPAEERFSEQTPDLFHTVVRGDTVSEIATRYGHSIRDVAAMNGLNRRYRIRLGQVLRLPLQGSVIVADASLVASVTAPQETALNAEVESAPLEVASLPEIDVPGPVQDSSLVLAFAPLEDTGEAPLIGGAGLLLQADPGDYLVADDNSIEVQGSETLGHYAEWLDLRASRLRRINGMPYGRPVVIGHRLKLDFSRITQQEFERRRLVFQKELQQTFFMVWQIRSTHQHVIAEGESLWVLTRRQYKIPLWLLRQYNPDLDPDKLRPGMVIVIPELDEA